MGLWANNVTASACGAFRALMIHIAADYTSTCKRHNAQLACSQHCFLGDAPLVPMRCPRVAAIIRHTLAPTPRHQRRPNENSPPRWRCPGFG